MQEEKRKRFEINVGGGYITWAWALDEKSATEWANNRYGHITKDIKVKGPLAEEYDPYRS